MNFATLRDGMDWFYTEINKRTYDKVIWGYWEKLGGWEMLKPGLLDRGRALPTWVCLVLVICQCLRGLLA